MTSGGGPIAVGVALKETAIYTFYELDFISFSGLSVMLRFSFLLNLFDFPPFRFMKDYPSKIIYRITLRYHIKVRYHMKRLHYITLLRNHTTVRHHTKLLYRINVRYHMKLLYCIPLRYHTKVRHHITLRYRIEVR